MKRNVNTNAHSALSIRIPTQDKRALERAAEEDRRSVTSLVQKIVKDWLARPDVAREAAE